MILDVHAPWTHLQMRAPPRRCMSTGQLQVQGLTHQPGSRLFKGWRPAVREGTMEHPFSVWFVPSTHPLHNMDSLLEVERLVIWITPIIISVQM